VFPRSQNVSNCSFTEDDKRATDSVNPKENQVTIRIEITGDNASQVASQLLTFTATMSQLLAPRASATEAVHQGPAPDTVVETVAEQPAAPARRGRPRKGETIEHEPKEKDDVRRDAGGNSVGSGADAGASGAEPGAGAADAAARVGAETDDAPAVVDAVAEADRDPAPAAPVETLTIDTVREHAVNNYLNACFDSLPERKAKFAELTSAFGVTKLNELPADKLGAFKALVDSKIAEALGNRTLADKLAGRTKGGA
jgi:hypothetical protein